MNERISEIEDRIFRIKMSKDFLSQKDWELIDKLELEKKELESNKDESIYSSNS